MTQKLKALRTLLSDRLAMSGLEYGVIAATLAVLAATIVVSHLVA